MARRTTGDAPQETPRAYAAKLRYAAQPHPRSLQRLAEEMQREQVQAYQKAQAEQATKLPPAPQKVINVLRTLKEWSRVHEWQSYCEERDAELVQQELAHVDETVREMNVNQSAITSGVMVMAFTRITALMQEDAESIKDWQLAMMGWRGRMLQRQAQQLPNDPTDDMPRRPRPLFGSMALVQLARLTLEAERIARQGTQETIGRTTEQRLPPVVEVELTTTPPPLPQEPTQVNGVPLGQSARPSGDAAHGLPREVLARRKDAPAALVRLTTQAPRAPRDEWTDEDESDDEASWEDDSEDDEL